jgi:hypothetical protein
MDICNGQPVRDDYIIFVCITLTVMISRREGVELGGPHKLNSLGPLFIGGPLNFEALGLSLLNL